MSATGRELPGEGMREGATDQSTKPSVARVSVEGPSISVTKSVDEAVMSNIIALLFGAVPSSSSTSSQRQRFRGQSAGTEQPLADSDDDLTLGEFLVETGAKTFPQKIGAAGYYLIKIQRAESFSREDVRTALANAHEDMPSNFTRDWSTAAASSLIAAKQGDAGQFYVPRTGRTAVESRFHDAPKRRNTKKATRRASSNSSNEGSK